MPFWFDHCEGVENFVQNLKSQVKPIENNLNKLGSLISYLQQQLVPAPSEADISAVLCVLG